MICYGVVDHWYSTYSLDLNPLYQSCARSGTFEFMNGCDLDQGSAVMCRYPQDAVWTLYGIVKQVKSCGESSASVIVKFEAVQNWIERYTGSTDSNLSGLNDNQTCGMFRDGADAHIDDIDYWQQDRA